MELQLTDDQTAFVATTRRFLAAECPIASVRALESTADGFDRGWWRRGAGLGWTSLLVGECDGGGSLSGHALADLALVAEELGHVVGPGPLVPVNVVAEAVSSAGAPPLRHDVLPGLLDGSSIAAWCGVEPVAARTDGDRFVLDGVCTPVEAAAQADHLLVAFRHSGGIGEAVIDRAAAGISVIPLDGLDLVRRFATVHLDGAVVEPEAVLGRPDDGDTGVERRLQVAVALQCAESVGVMEHVLTMTIEYLGDRWSFGRPLSSYQALKHRVADQKMWLEASHGIASAAIRAVGGQTPDAGDLVSAASWWIGPHATELVQDCVQLHGGIGVTWEHDLHLYLRRVTVNRAMYGTPRWHAERIATGLLGATA